MKSTRLLFRIHYLSSPTTKYFYQLNSIQSRCLLHTSLPLMSKDMTKMNLIEEHPHVKTMSKAIIQHKQSDDYMMNHEIYSEKELSDIKITHKKFESWHDRVAYGAVRTLRFFFDTFTGYLHPSKEIQHSHKTMTEQQWLRRFIFLESIAGVPGMVGGMSRHMKSLRTMRRDYGWIHMLLSEAENERMHLLTFLELRQPGWFFRGMVLFGQGVFFNAFFLTYLLSPRICHRFVGFLEEEAVITYTRCIEDLDAGKLPAWLTLSAPKIAKNYWKLSENAMMRDILLAIRADEATHREVNHKLADVGPDAPNPFLIQAKQAGDPSALQEH
ncbi:unnamed protein product [Rotaria sordida]|uniref:Alternative oxidase n=1 Tax=Rotaria sordida TaxID=392033 RepID=A0A813VZL9_9BILA|nr:unnamed protein product [Rotaria sordida]CAF3628364.1 unnamed protein product [Rotaria sordida]